VHIFTAIQLSHYLQQTAQWGPLPFLSTGVGKVSIPNPNRPVHFASVLQTIVIIIEISVKDKIAGQIR